MAITNASRLADFGSGIGAQGAIIQVDNASQEVGIGTTNPNATLTVGNIGASGTSIYVHGAASFASSSLDDSAVRGINNTTYAATIFGQNHGTGDVFAGYNGSGTKTSDISSAGAATFAGIVTTSQYFEDSIGKLRSIPQNSKTSSYTAVSSDSGKHISITTGGVTIGAAVFSVGDAFSIYNNSGSTQLITQGAGVTLRYAGSSSTGNRNLLQYGICSVLCVSSNEFVISGTGLS